MKFKKNHKLQQIQMFKFKHQKENMNLHNYLKQPQKQQKLQILSKPKPNHQNENMNHQNHKIQQKLHKFKQFQKGNTNLQKSQKLSQKQRM